jgi:hypothetical protein
MRPSKAERLARTVDLAARHMVADVLGYGEIAECGGVFVTPQISIGRRSFLTARLAREAGYEPVPGFPNYWRKAGSGPAPACLHCGASFAPKNDIDWFCSEACKRARFFGEGVVVKS